MALIPEAAPLDLRRLRHLQAATAEGSLTAAAATLGLSQPALSASIRALEAELGVPLLERHRHGVHATPYAEALLEHARRIDAELQAARAHMQHLRQAEAGSLRIGCGPSEATRLLPQALVHLRQSQPGLRVFVEYGLNEKLMPMVRLGEIDCALSSVPRSTAHAELRHEPLYTDQAVIVARADHPLASRRQPPVAELAQQPWVLARRWELERKALDDLFAQAGIEPPQAVVETTSAVLMKTLLLSSDFLTFVPREMIWWEERTGLLRPLRGFRSGWERQVGVTLRRDHEPSAALAALLDSLRHAVRRVAPGR
ncbi:MAG: LysR family transcriptional regulator [Rubrivivax sp.]|nr:LysR family transcriptional regulator [Rubrivivax sp.]